MHPKLKKWLKIILPLALGVFLIWFSLSRFTQDELNELWFNIKNVNIFWVIISFLMGILSHMSRAYRWQFLLEPVKIYPKFYNSFLSLMLGYLANLGVPRSGEILRGATLATYEDSKFENTFGTIITERVVDLVMLLSIVGLALIIQTDEVIKFFKNQEINPFLSLLIFVGLIVAFFIGFQIIKHTKNPFLLKVKNFAEELIRGMKSVFKMKKKWPFIFHTFVIWGFYVAMFYVLKYAFPETAGLSFDATLVAFVFGAFAMSITNGGIGLYPIAIGLAFSAFGVSAATGEAFGWVMWTTQTALVILIGGLSVILLPFLNNK
ncbi:lysylphosphatidylglycerol synthase transmembrane domain-containing protein [Psychroflexus aestuariivivens]|uniref:lysylphosphatidylglycerol synthase transmembrane domain-containing protein n=1 Tax=Psychroflexus aestuariivivens TaxID=1795040 RepID=UPI000FDA1772|nr:lysylphosphatidylglycerol synthase transmembrane domain-containing protein [Psychroflexus aestuariivivens]